MNLKGVDEKRKKRGKKKKTGGRVGGKQMDGSRGESERKNKV